MEPAGRSKFYLHRNDETNSSLSSTETNSGASERAGGRDGVLQEWALTLSGDKQALQLADMWSTPEGQRGALSFAE